MTPLTLVAALLALSWGIIWAGVLQGTRWGQFICRRRTWVAVSAGVAVDILVLGIILPLTAWLTVLIVISASAVPIITRSLINEYRETEAELQTAAREDSDG